ncbi:hypothetical protein ENUP19_0173G0005 [Entamoeba nuttalli]|uniref:Ras family GTPase n=1 Tax=Entamoeba nuttalli TaxID=412467 RepID=A0ABQ0DMX4_9EUKA
MSLNQQTCKLVVFGSNFEVGRSSVILRFVLEKFVESYDPTLDDTFTKELQIEDETVKLQIFDTVNTTDYDAWRVFNIRTGDGFILIYSITSKESFEEMKGIYEWIYRVKDKDENEVIPIIVVGNKCDLENERQVTKEEGIEYADSIKSPFIESSAKTNENINQIFDIITRNVLEYKSYSEEENWKIEKHKKEKGCCLFNI